MTTDHVHPLPTLVAEPRPAQITAAAAHAWPFNLKLLLFVLIAFAVNIAGALYLAGQMPS